MSRNTNLLPLLVSLVVTCGLLGVGAVLVIRLLGNQNPLQQLTENLGVPQSTPERAGANFSDVSNVPSGTFQYGGSTTWAPIRRDVDPLIQASWPNFRLRYTDPPTGTPGSGSGIRMLMNNQLAFAQSSRPLNEQERQQA